MEVFNDPGYTTLRLLGEVLLPGIINSVGKKDGNCESEKKFPASLKKEHEKA